MLNDFRRDFEMDSKIRLYSLGHSNRSWEEFLSLLREWNIGAAADVRRFPSSKRFPQFNQSVLSDQLHINSIQYHWFEQLGGRREQTDPALSFNTAIEDPSFRSYADHMQKEEFRRAVDDLLILASLTTTVFFCAEKWYEHCHRKLLSDYLIAQNAEVIHILESNKSLIHPWTPEAVITQNHKVIYPAHPLFEIEF